MADDQTLVTPPLTTPIPLEQGDHLTREEFERRYHALPNLKKAELIEGAVHMPSPVRFENHGWPHVQMTCFLAPYLAATPGVKAGDNSTARLDVINEPQPDLMLLITPEYGGQAKISADDYIEQAPELVAEIAASSVSLDLHTKLEIYRRTGVREYIVWRVQDRAIDWFVLRDEEFQPLQPSKDGTLRSGIFPGLWLDAQALINGDLAGVLATAQHGATSPEHAAFVQKLQAARASKA